MNTTLSSRDVVEAEAALGRIFGHVVHLPPKAPPSGMDRLIHPTVRGLVENWSELWQLDYRTDTWAERFGVVVWSSNAVRKVLFSSRATPGHRNELLRYVGVRISMAGQMQRPGACPLCGKVTKRIGAHFAVHSRAVLDRRRFGACYHLTRLHQHVRDTRPERAER